MPSQPIFYPVLNLDYGIQIARDWNTTDPNSGFAGFVTQFDIDDAYISKFEVQIVGSSQVHQELWIPAEDLAEFNRHILGEIKIVAAYYGNSSTIEVDPDTNMPTTIQVSK
ncbi:ADP-ribosylation/crystallin J1 [Chamaesiphon polymorphus]|uniref:ADP-ribosylation/crystallin J1 n=1 Tax=Chamaesiphon polymorphus TaxID=2107691 RepID=UPI0015E62FD4|nr:ADP-ribosylation/crystallin J1 [Chamaesiphon polymorphus]